MRKVVLKIGTSVLINKNIDNIAMNVARIKEMSTQLSLVSSGAVGYGKKEVKKYIFKNNFSSKGLAAIGQGELFVQYKKCFEKCNIAVAQIMVTKEVYKKTLNELLKNNILPIINGNDPDSPINLMYEDNDTLAGDVAIKSGANLLIIITDVDGVYNINPSQYKKAKKYKVLNKISKELLNNSKDVGSDCGTGGMYTKLLTAQKLLRYGIDVYITSSLNDAMKYLESRANDPQCNGTLISGSVKAANSVLL